MYSFTLPSISALDGGGWSTPRPGRFTPGKDPVLIALYIYIYTHTYIHAYIHSLSVIRSRCLGLFCPHS